MLRSIFSTQTLGDDLVMIRLGPGALLRNVFVLSVQKKRNRDCVLVVLIISTLCDTIEWVFRFVAT